MIKNKLIALFLFVAVAANAAQIKDVRFNCDSKKCAMTFQFASDSDLPTFFQKYDAKTHRLTLGFSATTFALGEGVFDVDASSDWVKAIRVFKEPFHGTDFLKVEMAVGSAINTDKNAIALEKSDFKLTFNGKNGKSWTLSKLFGDSSEAPKLSLESTANPSFKALLKGGKSIRE